MSRISRCKNLQRDMLTKDPKFGFFTILVAESVKPTKQIGLGYTPFSTTMTFQTFRMTSPPTRESRILVSISLLLDLPFSLIMTQLNGLLNMPTQNTAPSIVAHGCNLLTSILRSSPEIINSSQPGSSLMLILSNSPSPNILLMKF